MLAHALAHDHNMAAFITSYSQQEEGEEQVSISSVDTCPEVPHRLLLTSHEQDCGPLANPNCNRGLKQLKSTFPPSVSVGTREEGDGHGH